MYLKIYAALFNDSFLHKLHIAMINTMIIEIVDNVFVILLDNSSSSPFSLGVLDEGVVGELFVVVAAVTVVVATVGNGATDVVVVDNGAADVVLAIDTDAADVVAVDTGAVVLVIVVCFNTQIRSVVRLPLNEMYSLLLHCSQFVQLVPLN